MRYTSTSSITHRPRSVTGALAVAIGAILAVAGISASSTLAYSSSEALPSTAASNEPGYWGANCTKLDQPGGLSWTADADYGIVVLKAAQTDYVYYGVVKGDVLNVGKNAISHFIFCPPTTTTTTTTTATTTTTLVGDTTTTTTATTLVDDTTTTVEEATPTTLLAQAGPTTTSTAGAGATTTPLAVDLPRTGVDTTTSLTVIGGLLMAAGIAMLTLARRPTAS